MKTSTLTEREFSQADFFKHGDLLRQQLERALSTEAKDGSSPLALVEFRSAYRFFLATGDQVFSRDLVAGFLTRLRHWGKEKLDARHASTPQVHVYVDGCRRDLAPDAVRARWHYLYSLTRTQSPKVRILDDNDLQIERFGIALSRVTSFQLPFNQLLVHETRQAYSLENPSRADKPLEGTVLLHGYLW